MDLPHLQRHQTQNQKRALSGHPDNYIVETGAARPACPPDGQTERPPHDDEQPSDSTEPRRGWLEKFRFVHIIDATGGDVRDHLALERTWLAYNRTANTLASYAVVVAQLFILHEHKRTIGRVCGVIMICGAILIDLVSALRYLQQSHGLATKGAVTGKGRAVLGTISLTLCAAIVGGISLGLFILVLVVE